MGLFRETVEVVKNKVSNRRDERILYYTPYERRLAESNMIDLFIRAFKNPDYYWSVMNEDERGVYEDYKEFSRGYRIRAGLMMLLIVVFCVAIFVGFSHLEVLIFSNFFR